MTKRRIELEVDDINLLVSTLKTLAVQGLEAHKFAKERGLDLPKEVEQTIVKVMKLYKSVSRANRKVEVAELEAIFDLEFDGSPSLNN
jgi:hypothetical protein